MAIELGQIDLDEVYVSSNRNECFHLDPDCALAGDRTVAKDPAVLFDDLTMCTLCQSFSRRWKDL